MFVLKHGMETAMNFQCKNCSANMIFSPEKQNLYCPFCEGTGCDEKLGDDSLTTCPSCGGALEVGEFTSSTQCPSCGNYIILDKRVSDNYRPDRVIPFKLSKDDAIGVLEEEFSDRIFTPSSFLSEKTLVNMQGYYVPFFMYDYHADCKYVGDASKTRSWREGNYDITETSYFKLYRELKADYDNVPVDASISMPDETMDLLEPFDYQLLTDFDPRVMSGFSGEIYNMSADELASRAEEKASDSTSEFLKESMSQFTLSQPDIRQLTLTRKETEFALLPVWKYSYFYGNTYYPFYVNGESGKVVGKTPISKLKVFLYAITCAGLWGLVLDAILGILGGWLF